MDSSYSIGSDADQSNAARKLRRFQKPSRSFLEKSHDFETHPLE